MKIQKKIIAYLFFIIVIQILLSGCYDLEDGSVYTPPVVRSLVHSEKDFLTDTTLYSLPGEIVVIDLEHLNTPPDSITPGTDTDGIGVDEFLFRIKDTMNISFRIDTANYIIEMFDKQTLKKVLLLNEDIPQRIRRYDPGKYIITITSLLNYGDDTLNNQLIFIQPDIASTKSNLSADDEEIFWFIRSRVRVCKECNLKYYDFSGFDLSLVDFDGAQLNNTIFRGAVLPLSNLSDADMTSCDLTNAYLPKANIFNSILENAVLDFANIEEADLGYADLTKASLRYTYAIGTNFCFTVRTKWDTTGIITDTTTLCLP